MHNNLVAIQEKMVKSVRENMKVLEIYDSRCLILAALAAAEKPLGLSDLIQRTELREKEAGNAVKSLAEKGIIIQSGKDAYDFNPEMEKAVALSVQEKLDALRANMKREASEYESLLKSGQAEFDDYDRLMAKYLNERIAKMKLIASVLLRRNSLLRLLDNTRNEDAGIEKLSIH
jgi:DNA-binding transcriptional regulator GbsR (MarR family)